MMKRLLVILLLLVSTTVASLELWNYAAGQGKAYPRSDINGFIAWAAGGATDTLSRTIVLHARKYLGQNIVLQNKTGATGAIATEFVHNQPPDGYSLLFNAENPTLYKLLDISQIDYDDFYPVLIIGTQPSVLVVPPDSPYKSVTDLIKDAQARPGQVKIGISGVGGLPFNVATMLETTSHVTFNSIPFDGDSTILTALMGHHVDISVVNYSAAADQAKAGCIRILTTMTNTRLPSAPNVEAMGEVLHDYAKYFPWGAFVGIYVRKETPRPAREVLTKAFQSAFAESRFQSFLEENYISPLGLSGEEARRFINRWQSVTAWLLEDAGAAKVSAGALHITRVEEAGIQ